RRRARRPQPRPSPATVGTGSAPLSRAGSTRNTSPASPTAPSTTASKPPSRKCPVGAGLRARPFEREDSALPAGPACPPRDGGSRRTERSNHAPRIRLSILPRSVILSSTKNLARPGVCVPNVIRAPTIPPGQTLRSLRVTPGRGARPILTPPESPSGLDTSWPLAPGSLVLQPRQLHPEYVRYLLHPRDLLRRQRLIQSEHHQRRPPLLVPPDIHEADVHTVLAHQCAHGAHHSRAVLILDQQEVALARRDIHPEAVDRDAVRPVLRQRARDFGAARFRPDTNLHEVRVELVRRPSLLRDLKPPPLGDAVY